MTLLTDEGRLSATQVMSEFLLAEINRYSKLEINVKVQQPFSQSLVS